ncbi:MAG: transcription termination factor NusA [Chloroflexota bacterium]
MKSDFLIALTQLAAERNLPRDIVLSAIEAALVSAFRKDSIATGQEISVKLDPGTGDVSVYLLKKVVDEVENDLLEITLKDARKYKADIEVGDNVAYEKLPASAGRIAAQTAKQVVLQRLREAERELVYEEYADKEGEVYTVNVQRVDSKQVVCEMGRAEAILPLSEQIQTERYRVGQKIKVLLKSLERSVKGPELIISRADDDLLKRLFEMEVPEIYNGSVEIKAIAREPGARSKVAVFASQEGVDPVGSCVGLRGIRIQNIVNELHGEKIDVVQWDENPIVFISQALSPSQVLRVDLVQDDLSATAVVPENTLSLAIGKEGQNARLAAKLTGWKVDIKSDVEVAGEEPVEPVTTTKVSKEKPVTPEVTEAVEETSITEAKEAQEEEPPVQDDGDEVVESTDVAETGDTEVVEDTESTTEDSSEEKELIAAVAEASGEQEATETEDESLESAADLSEEVWNIRKPSVPVDPGQIRFAEDIEELFKNGPAKRRGTRKRRPRTNKTARKK